MEGTSLSWTIIDFNETRNIAAIYRFRGMFVIARWDLIDDNPDTRQIEIDTSGPLYQRHVNGSLWRYVGPGIKWEPISDHVGATLIAAGSGGALYYTYRFESISRYTRNVTTDSTQTLSGAPEPTLSLIAKAE
jgi:hypothetical protein